MNNNEYIEIIETIKGEIRGAQYKAALSVNRELIMLYYHIGTVINEHKTWGSKFIENLAADIRIAFPNVKGYSVRNLKYMAKFAETYPDEEFVQTVSAQIPWSHNTAILDKVKDAEQRVWYIKKTAENGWSHNVLIHQIESGLYERQALAEKISNFETRLASPQSELAVQTMKDPYIFDFIPFREDMVERDIENALVKDVTKLLLELGTGFAFLGNQYHLNVGGDDFYIDLLFYNLNLRCYVVIELKTGEFKPEYAGQLNFYLSAVDGIIKHPEDNPSIGLLLCKSKNDLVAEYALKDMSKPIGVSEYKITSSLPEALSKQLPSVEDITSDAHEGLVSREVFQAVQRILEQASDERKKKMEKSKAIRESLIDLFDGRIFCADCQQRMYFHRHKIDKDKRGRWLAYYECSTYTGRRAVRCTAHRTRSELIEEKVLRALQLHIRAALDYELLISKLNESKADRKIRNEFDKSIQSVTLKLRAVSQKRARLYEDFADGILSEEEYAYAKTSFDGRWEALNRQLDELTARRTQYSETMSGENRWIKQMKSVEVTDTLTQAIVDATIEKVFIYENKTVEIIFKYHDIFKQTERYLEELCAKEGEPT